MSLDVSVQKKLKGFSLDVNFRSDGEILGILGASGCGKSMTLKCVAGIEEPTSGRIVFGDRVLFDSSAKINVRPQKRRVGYLFQNYALFPNMRVRENIACGIRDVAGRDKKVDAQIRRFRLGGLEHRYPAQLSGGQQQRVALARVLASEPEVLLLDEPFSALDYFLKEQLQAELLELLQSYDGDIVLVTHSRDEVYRLCKNVMVLEEGACMAYGDTKEIFADPGCLSAARLTGCKNIVRADKTGPSAVYVPEWGVNFSLGRPVPDDLYAVGIRAHDFHPATNSDGVNTFPIRVRTQLESQFEWNIVFSPGGAREPQSAWWMTSKELYAGSAPEFLMVPPEKILPLRA